MGGLCSRQVTVDIIPTLQDANGRREHRNPIISNHSGPLPKMNQPDSFAKKELFPYVSPARSYRNQTDREEFDFENEEHQNQHPNRNASQLPPKLLSGQPDFQRLFPNVVPLRMHSGSVDVEDFSEDFGERGDNGDKKRLARVLSAKAKSARTMTTNAARKGAAKVNEMGAILGRAGNVGLGKAVEALDTLGSSMTSFNFGSSFTSAAPPRGNKIGILAFEVANTVVKGFNLKQTLLPESMKVLKEEILRSEGVQRLVSTDTVELLKIAADDKRNELKVFSGEVVRFGNHCRDPQWHHLDRLFNKLGAESSVQRQTKEETETEMQHLMILAQHTAELYHELHALDRFETDYRRKLEEEEIFDSQRGDSLAILRSELKSQKKHVKNLKKKSLWSYILEEVMEKLVDIVYFLHQEIQNAFGDAGQSVYGKDRKGSPQRLGPAGLSLHYANIINQIDSLVSRPGSIPPNMRDSLYQGLPPSIKVSLRSKLSMPIKEEFTIPQIKEEMERTLAWLVPVAANTTKAHHGFGWVGEWANTGSLLDQRLPGHHMELTLTLLQTLHHADQKETEHFILELIVWLNHLVSLKSSTTAGSRSPMKSPMHSPLQHSMAIAGNEKHRRANGDVMGTPELSLEDQEMLQGVKNKRYTPGISKSQEFSTSKVKAAYRTNRLSKSSSHSPCTSTEVEFGSSSSSSSSRRHVVVAPFNFETDKSKTLDVIDRVDQII